MAYKDYSDLPLALTVYELMAVLGIGRNSAYNLVHSKQIHSVTVGRQIRIPKQALLAYLESVEKK